jgi:hypothetical protein
LIAAIDLGTASATAAHAMRIDFYDTKGKLCRKPGQDKRVFEVKDWPGYTDATSNSPVCVPTTLLYKRESRQFECWGFEATARIEHARYKPQEYYMVEYVKLLLPNTDDPDCPIPLSERERYRNRRLDLMRVLGKTPDDVFQDLMDHIIEYTIAHAHEIYPDLGSPSRNDHLELVLAFPSSWPDSVHRRVSEICTLATTRALDALKIHMAFGLESVYPVSETLCGVREWLRTTIAEAATSNELEPPKTYMDEFQVR